jgi:predicted metal-dependent phosphoesterase TrpH
LTPQQLVEAARQAGVKALAITDHDTLGGWDEAIAAAEGTDLEIVPGVELSTVQNGRSLHMLGFYPDRDRFEPLLQQRLAGRKRRTAEMVRKLEALGYPIELPELGEGMAPGRPHVAAALVKAGHVQSSTEAFERFIGEDKPAYVGYEKFTTAEGIQMLRSCGAVPVWAHPYLFRGGAVETVLPELLEAGLMGLEIHHPYHSSQQVAQLKTWCETHGLLMTGGTDYHGPQPKSDGTPAVPLNTFHVPLEFLAPLKQAAQDLLPATPPA